MNFAVEFTDVADMEVQNILLWIMGRSPEQAEPWQDGLENAVMSLTSLPKRCPLASEQDAFDVEVRQLLYGKYRLLFTLVDTDNDGEPDTVRILHVRHGAQRPLYRIGTGDDVNP
jgi:plasmid stabilization system protein ParE